MEALILLLDYITQTKYNTKLNGLEFSFDKEDKSVHTILTFEKSEDADEFYLCVVWGEFKFIDIIYEPSKNKFVVQITLENKHE